MLEPYVAVGATPIRETEKAILANLDLGDTHYTQIWVPKSVLHPDSQDEMDEAVRGEPVELYIAKWWLEENL